MGRAAFTAKQFFYYLALEIQAETSLIPHGKVLSFIDYTLPLPNLPNPKCPVSGVHPKLHVTLSKLTITSFSISFLSTQFSYTKLIYSSTSFNSCVVGKLTGFVLIWLEAIYALGI